MTLGKGKYYLLVICIMNFPALFVAITNVDQGWGKLTVLTQASNFTHY